MADNTVLNAGSGGDTIATDDDGTAKHQWVKVEFGGNGTFTAVTSSVGLPVGDAGGSLTVDAPVGTPVFVRLSDGSAAITTLPVSIAGTVTIAGAVTNAGTFAVQESGAALTALQLIDNLVLAEDAAHVSGDPGVQALAILKATPADTAGTDGDYQPLQMSGGRLWVDASGKTLTVGSHAVTNAGTFAVQVDGAALTSLQLIDDAVSGAGFNITQLGGVNVSMGNGVSGTGVLRVTIASDSTGTVAATQSGTWNVGTVTTVSTVTNVATIGTSVTPGTSAAHLGKAEDAAHASGDTGVMLLAVRSDTAASTSGTDGDYTALITDSTGKLHVNVGNTVTVASHAVTNAGTFAVQIDAGAVTSLALLDDVVFADDVAFTPATSKVAAVGFLADETATDSVDEGDIGIARMTLDRKIHVVNETEGATLRESGTALTVKRVAIAAASSGENTLVSAVASKKIRVLSMAIVAAGAVNVYFNCATAGVCFGGSTNKINLAANGGFVLPHNPHGWFQTGTNNEDLRMNLSGAVAVSGGLTYVEV